MESLQPHIQLGKDLQIKYALMPGDPARLDRIAPFLENVTELKFNREYRSLSGTYKGVPILAISTGIGGASAGIAVVQFVTTVHPKHISMLCSPLFPTHS